MCQYDPLKERGQDVGSQGCVSGVSTVDRDGERLRRLGCRRGEGRVVAVEEIDEGVERIWVVFLQADGVLCGFLRVGCQSARSLGCKQYAVNWRGCRWGSRDALRRAERRQTVDVP